MTCNSKWPEIERETHKNHPQQAQTSTAPNYTPKYNASDRPDLIARVFKGKLDALLKELTYDHVLGQPIAHLH
eukprot:5192733-Pleurochrysis_carterae.AAC.1